MHGDLRLIRHGVILVVLGLMSGFATAVVLAPRLALASHTIGVLQGTLAIALGFLWPVLNVAGYRLQLTRWAILVGFYCNWLGALLAGVWGAKKMMFVSGATMPEAAASWQEILVALLLNASILVLIAFIYLIYVLSKVVNDSPSP